MSKEEVGCIISDESITITMAELKTLAEYMRRKSLTNNNELPIGFKHLSKKAITPDGVTEVFIHYLKEYINSGKNGK